MSGKSLENHCRWLGCEFVAYSTDLNRPLFLEVAFRSLPPWTLSLDIKSFLAPPIFCSLFFQKTITKEMHPLSFALSALLAFVAVRAAPQGQPSGAPTCRYNCPPTDNAGFALGRSSDDGTTLFCSYPLYAGENPDDFDCKYSDVSFFQRIYMLEPTHAKSNLIVYRPAHGRRWRWFLSPDGSLPLSYVSSQRAQTGASPSDSCTCRPRTCSRDES